MAELDRGAHDDRAVVVEPHLQHERLVDLELVDGHPAQVGQRGIPGAVVVDGEADAQVADGAEHVEGALGVGHDRALGDLDGEPGGGDAVALEHVGDEARQVEVAEQPGRDVEGHGDVVAAVVPAAQGRDCVVDAPARERVDQPAVLGEGDEHVGVDDAVARVQPTAERLDGQDVAGARADLRLEREHELVVVDRAVQVAEQREALDRVAVDLRPIALYLAAVGLGAVQRDVRPLEQRLERVCVLRGQRDADAGLHAEPHAVDDDRLAQLLGELGGELIDRRRVRDVAEQHCELVAAEPGDRDVAPARSRSAGWPPHGAPGHRRGDPWCR